MHQKLSFRLFLVFSISLAAAGCGPVSAALNDPHSLPALERDPRVHYDRHAKGYAERLAQLLPKAMARVEQEQGRPFGRPFVIAAYLDEDAYAAANGSGDARARGVAFFDRVTMSPAIWREEPGFLEAYLTHELSHEHLLSHLSPFDYFRVPAWFLEGLAVAVSDGGGAQRVAADDAMREIAAGRFIATPDETGSILPHGFAPPQDYENDDERMRMHMAYRQAGLFVRFLRAQNPSAFRAFMERLLAGERFSPAFEESFASSVAENRARFLARIASRPMEDF
jgi:hypothetical protein